MRRNIGVSGIIKRQQQNSQFASVGKHLEETKLSHVAELIEKFSESLSSFAEKHKQQINSDPKFRMEFCKMCKVTTSISLITTIYFSSVILIYVN